MIEENSFSTLKIYYKDEYGYETEIKKTFDNMDSIGLSDIDQIATIINDFMKAAGFVWYDKHMVFLESIDEEEYEYLDRCLKDRREAMKKCVTCGDYIYNDGNCYGGVNDCEDYIENTEMLGE